MKNLTATLCLTLTLLLGSVGNSESADFQFVKGGYAAYKSGDFATALREWTHLAEQGFADAQSNLGVMYEKGQGVPKDYKTAEKWYTLAANQGYVHAYYNLGFLYQVAYDEDEGVVQDFVRSYMWFHIVALSKNKVLLKSAVKYRDIAATNMTPTQIKKAQELARNFVPNNNTTIVFARKSSPSSLPPCPSSKDFSLWTDCVGTYNCSSCDKYVGEWKNGKEDGFGTFTSFSSQKVKEGVWENGKFVKEGTRGEVLPWIEKRKKERIAKEKERIAKEKQRKKERIAREKQRKKERIAKEKQRKKERIAKEKQRKKERIAREKQRKKERIAREKQQKIEEIARQKRIASNPGFRDLKPGLRHLTIEEKRVCKGSLNNKSGTTCYGLENLKFSGTFNSGYLEKLTVDLGPIVDSVGFLNTLSTYMQKGETNVYLKMRESLGKKYKMDFEFTERDRQLFNQQVKDKLYTVYNGGQVALLITRKKRGYSKDLWLYVEYRDVKPARTFFKSSKPKRAKASDF